MSSGGKGGAGSVRYDYFGTLAGAVCLGPVDTLTEVIFDGKSIWSGNAHRSGDTPADLTSAVDAKYFFGPDSYLKFYFGTAGQVADPALADSPDYRGIAYLVAKGFLFGKDKSTAPNLEVLCVRKPVVDTTLVPSADNTLDDGQVSPVAALAELLTAHHGAGLSLDLFDLPSWNAAAGYAKAHRDRCYCSPLIAEATDLRDAAHSLLAMIDGVLAWTASGQLALKLLQPGIDPGGLVTITGPQCLDNPALAIGSWGEVPTTAVVTYDDRARSFKRADESMDNLVARKLRGENHTANFDLPHVTRRSQAAAFAADLIRKLGQPSVTATISLRTETIGNLGPGDKLRFDLDPEPLSDQMPALAVIDDRRDDASGTTKLKLVIDPLSSHAVTAGTFADPVEAPTTVPDLVHALVIPLPIKAPGWERASIGVLASRPSAVVTQMRVYFDVDADTGDFADLGIQTGFACRLAIASSITTAASAATLTLADGAAGPDAYLAGQLPEKTVDAKSDKVLLVLASVDANDRVTVTGGVPDLEIASVVTRAAVSGTTHTYTVLRGRKTTRARAWTTSDQAWLIPAHNLTAWSHPDIGTLIQSGAVGHVRLLAMSAGTEAANAYERTFVMPVSYQVLPVVTWTSPASNLGLTDAAGDIALDLTVIDADANLVSLRVDSKRADGTDPANHASLSFAPTGSRTWSGTIKLVPGVWFLTVTATDLNGNATVATRVLQNDNAGADLHVPDATPGSGAVFSGSLIVSVNLAAPADQFEYLLDYLGSEAPPGAGTLIVGTTSTITIPDTRRLWLRSGDGTTWSPWIFADYFGT